MEYKEEAQQKLFVRWFKIQYPFFSRLIMSIPNGQNVGGWRGQRLKDMGLLSGAPDLLLAVPTRRYSALFIEMKSITGNVTKMQKEIHAGLSLKGYRVDVCYSADEAIVACKRYIEDTYDEEVRD